MAASDRRISSSAPAACAGRGGRGLRAHLRRARAGRRPGRRRLVPLRHPDHPHRARVRAGRRRGRGARRPRAVRDLRRDDRRLRHGDRPDRLVNRYLTKDGGYRWIEWSSAFDPEQGLIYAAARDVTDRREAEQRVREAEERFRRSFEDSPTGMALVDARGGRILEVNEALVALTGLSRAELVGSDSLQGLVHVDDVGFVRDGLERLQRGELPVMRIELRLRGLAGQVRWIDFNAPIVRG